ncbi:MAG: SdpI family protein [Phycisphaerae bacterium]|jgi:hypothetical protein
MKTITLLSILAQSTTSRQQSCEVLFFVAFTLIGLLFIAISIPLLLGRVSPNIWYGFRTKKTISDSSIWYKANKYMAKGFLILGMVQILYNVWLIAFRPAIAAFEPAGNLIILVAGTAIVITASLLYLRKL